MEPVSWLWSKKGEFYWVFFIFFVSVLVSVILVTIFARNNPNSQIIVPSDWALVQGRKPRPWSQPSAYGDQLKQVSAIWNQANPLDLSYRPVSGRGIVIAGGTKRYYTSAYMLIRELRHVGCELPIELWYREGELVPEAIKHLDQFGVTCLNMDEHLTFDFGRKFSIKVMAMCLSGFQELLYLDADNNVVRDPTFLFDHEAYRSTGALFWPDYWRMDSHCECFMAPELKGKSLGLFQQESGQMVVDKGRCWRQLWFTFRIVENGLTDLFPGPYNHGDKDVFQFTWAATGQPFHMVPVRVASIGKRASGDRVYGIAMGQHGPDGQLLFVHQNFAEWIDRTDSIESYWRFIKRHTHPVQGSVEHGPWNPVGPSQLLDFRKSESTIEDEFIPYMGELVEQKWWVSWK